MKGIFIINSLEGGGAERVFAKLISLINDDVNGDSIDVILIDNKKVVYALPKQIRVHRLNTISVFKSIWRYLSIIRKIKPDYVVSFLTRANNYNVFGGCFFAYKSIVSERSNTSGRLQGRFVLLKKKIVQNLYKKASCIIAVSEGVKHCLIQDFNIQDSKIAILNNSVDVSEVNQKASNAELTIEGDYIVAVGRLVKTKGFDTLIKAFALSGVACDLRILGDGPERKNLQALVGDLGLSDRVYFEGFQTNPYTYIKQSLFFVLPSTLEGFPNALVEALGLGKAVLSTNCTDGPSEILALKQDIPFDSYIATEFGLIVNVNDTFALSQGLYTLYKDTDLRIKYEKNSTQCAQRYSPNQFYENFKYIVDCIFDTPLNITLSNKE